MNSHNASNQVAYYLLGFSLKAEALRIVAPPAILTQLRIEHRVCREIEIWYKVIERREFEGPDADRNLSDLNWLTPRVLAHESVVSRLDNAFTFYPARFGCLFSSLEVLMYFAERNRATLMNYFQQAHTRKEWGIKFTTDLDRATENAVEKHLRSANSNGSDKVGTNYLKVKQLQRSLKEPVRAELRATCDARIDELGKLTKHIVRRPITIPAQPDRETMLANVALWLEPLQIESMRTTCDEWQKQSEQCGIQTTITGPWPSYSFCPSLEFVDSVRSAA